MPIFNKTPFGARRREIRQLMKKTPDSFRKTMNPKQRMDLEKKLLPKKWGDNISEQELQRTLKDMKRDRFNAKTIKDRTEIDRNIKYLEKIDKM